MFTTIHHVGYWVENLDAATAAYQRVFGAELSSRGYNAIRHLHYVFARTGNTRVELMEPDDKSMFADARGPILAHVAYEVPDIRQAMRELEARGVVFRDKTPWTNAQGWQIAYFDGGENVGAALHLIQV